MKLIRARIALVLELDRHTHVFRGVGFGSVAGDRGDSSMNMVLFWYKVAEPVSLDEKVDRIYRVDLFTSVRISVFSCWF